MPLLQPDVPTIVYSGTDIPRVWRLNNSDYWIAPTLEEAIQESMKLSGLPRDEIYESGLGEDPISEEALASMTGFYNSLGEPQSGLEAYQERLANGATVEPFGVIE